MRLFYEEWKGYVNRQPLAGEINWNEFISLGFTHHMEILSKTTEIKERIFYIHECATRAWDKYTLREYIKSGLYQKRENLPNNFLNTLTDRQFAIKATKAFSENYLLDFINTENLGEVRQPPFTIFFQPVLQNC